MKRSHRRNHLALCRETIKILSERDVRAVHGGYPPKTATNFVPTSEAAVSACPTTNYDC